MSKYLSQVLVYIFFISASCHCQGKINIYNQKSIELNNTAVKFIQVNKFDSALIYLNQSINIDSTYYLAYANKCVVYCSLKDYASALKMTEKEINIKPDLAEGWTFAGMLNDELGDTLNALTYYKKSIEIYNDRISNPDKQKYLKANKGNRAICYILAGQEEKGRDELKKLKELYPSDASFDEFLKLTKQEYLNQIFKNQ
jgi:tetratricopeptide (TPR) repeat protein